MDVQMNSLIEEGREICLNQEGKEVWKILE